MHKAFNRIINKPWKHVLVAAIALALSYALVSWAIDTGRLMAYFGSLVLGILVLHQLVQAIKGYARKS